MRLRAGDFVPADTGVMEGDLHVDQSVVTGESQELDKHRDETLYSGSIVRRGEATAVVRATGTRTYLGRATQLVATAQPKLHVEALTARLVRWLFIIVGVLVGTALVLSVLRGSRSSRSYRSRSSS